jgi:hypothetical protein
MTLSRKHRLPDGALPTPAQVDLLRAASLGAGAAGAWRDWRSHALSIDDLDDASLRVLPRLWLNHAAAGIEADDLPRLRGTYRKAFAENVLVLAGSLEGLAAIESAGVPAVLIKGGAVLALQSTLGARTLADLDVLIPIERVAEARAALSSVGFEAEDGAQARLVDVRHAWSFRNHQGVALDLHWYAFKTPGDDREVFARARVGELLGRSVAVPEAGELVLQVCVHGVGPWPASVRWIADAMALLANDADPIDWRRVVARAKAREVTVAAREAFGVLADEIGAPIPGFVLDELRRTPASWRERAAHRAVVEGWRGSFYLSLVEFHRRARMHGAQRPPRDLLGHFADFVNVQHRRTVLDLAVRRAWRRLSGGTREPWEQTGRDWRRRRSGA